MSRNELLNQVTPLKIFLPFSLITFQEGKKERIFSFLWQISDTLSSLGFICEDLINYRINNILEKII